MSITETRTIQQIAADREQAETALAQAEGVADVLRVEHAVAVLHEAFPGHTLAVFGRAWDEDAPHLMQLLAADADVEPIDLGDSDSSNNLSREQSVACSIAERAIRLIGDDNEVWRYLEPGEEEHEDWYEFNLPLKG